MSAQVCPGAGGGPGGHLHQFRGAGGQEGARGREVGAGGASAEPGGSRHHLARPAH